MTIEQLAELRNAEPFRPFRLQTADGRSIAVDHPFALGYHPENPIVVTVVGSDDRVHTLRPEEIVGVEVVEAG